MKRMFLVVLIIGLLALTGFAAKTIGFSVSTLANPFFVTMKEGERQRQANWVWR